MRFWLGAHHPNWLETEVDLFVSRRTLMERKTLPVAAGPWALDSGGFTELNLYGHWQTEPREYVADVLRFEREIGNLQWVAPQDWMCEPFVLEKTGGSVAVHQQMTVENFLYLREELGELVIPVLQGWTIDDYHNCWGMYEAAGVDLSDEPLVGVGSVCRRQSTVEIATIFRSLHGLSLHGFGVKTEGLTLYADVLTSADSMAWSATARNRIDDTRQPSLFPWPKKMLCGRMYPTEHKAKTCANCREWALQWRESILSNLEVAV